MGRPRKHEFCTIQGCGRAHAGKGLCALHYGEQRRRQEGRRVGCGAGRPPNVAPCKVEGCTNRQRAKGFCARHYRKERWSEVAVPTIAAKYGLTVLEYIGLGAQCQICKAFDDGTRVLDVDHDHATGKVRGLLCRRCNMGLGLFLDRKDLLAAAMAYLT